MKLYIMRHGAAEDHSESGADGDRALTAAGRERVRDVAKALVDAKEEPLLLVTSPLVRAVQTAEIVAIVTRLGERDGNVEVSRDIAPEGDARRLVRKLASEQKKRVMLVGHEPDLSGLVASLVGHFGRGFEKAMVVCVSTGSQGTDGRLRFVLEPKTLKLDTTAEPGS
jgi:phosphohistidine phosphatase